ncbi:phage regulatory CII family protein [Mesorhizobium muleiense]|uniref:phage regulatory CII family protein n=1 Tax=Mesorhizobium muleiense TaxID=1004279 RepID=UPI001F442025|nr:phage regulatory CII family protein [Mesorhizobium muleiense]MCF6112343.1 hypothetical protein [Mesorhizobium muleiense]
MAEISSQWFYRLKAAQRDLIERCGTIERAAAIASLSKSQMGRFNNAGDPELMPLSAVLLLEAECGTPLVTSVMAELNGRRLADADAPGAANATMMAAHADVVVQFGELIAAAAMAFADGRLTPAELAGIDRGAAKLETALAELRKSAAAARGSGGLSLVGGAA